MEGAAVVGYGVVALVEGITVVSYELVASDVGYGGAVVDDSAGGAVVDSAGGTPVEYPGVSTAPELVGTTALSVEALCWPQALLSILKGNEYWKRAASASEAILMP